MESAQFFIESYRFNKVIIDLSNKQSNELKIEIIPKGTFEFKSSRFNLYFVFKAFSETSENAFIEIECIGIFGFKENTTFEKIPDFFYNNSMAILFPYLRAFISLVTLQINIPPLILPTLNLSSLEADLRKNTFNI